MNHRLATVLIGGLTIAAGLSACHRGPHPTFTVDSSLDIPDAVPGDGICDTGTGICTLRAAIDESNTLLGEDTATIELTVDVDLSIPGTQEDTNTTGDLDITHTVTINGQGHTIDAHQLDRVIDQQDGELTIIDTTITGGYVDVADGYLGGGIKNDSNGDGLTLIGVTITNNTAAGASALLHLFDVGDLQIVGSSISGNTDIDDYDFWADAIVFGSCCGDGEPSSPHSFTLSQSVVSNNTTGRDGHSGLSIVGGSVLIEDTLFSGNHTEECEPQPGISCLGSALTISWADVTLRRTSIVNNTGPIPAVVILDDYAFDDDNPVVNEDVLIEDVLIADNVTLNNPAMKIQGFDSHQFILRNSTIAGDLADGTGALLIEQYDPNGTNIGSPAAHRIESSTLIGDLRTQDGYNPPTTPFSVSVLGSVIHGTCTGYNASAGYNWTSDWNCDPLQPTDIVGVDPMLGPLQDNGGPTHTRLPLTGSPLLNAIAWNTAGACDATTSTDQRGLPRPATAATNCDIGATERQPTDP